MTEFHFANLTPDTILDAIEGVGIYPESGLLPLNSFENRVYQFKADDNQRYVVKFYRPKRWSEAQIQEEHDFSFALGEAEVPVVMPLRRDGESLFEHQGYRFTLFPSVGGRLFEMDNLDQLEMLGRLIGRMHQVAGQTQFQHRPSFSVASFMHQARTTLAESGLVSAGIQLAFFTVLDQVIEKTARMYQPKQSMRLHGDCHAGNILFSRDELMFVDLDDARNGPQVQDLWMMLSGNQSDKLLQLDTLLAGYEEFCDFDHSQLALIEPLRAMRMVNYMAWLASRWQDAAFQMNFSWFATDKYWEQQILALKEQLAALDEAPLQLRPF